MKNRALCNAAVGGLGVGSRNASPAPLAAFVHLALPWVSACGLVALYAIVARFDGVLP